MTTKTEATCTYPLISDAEPSCPACGHYNAMLVDWSAPDDGRDHRKCRDCGATAVRIPHSEATHDDFTDGPLF